MDSFRITAGRASRLTPRLAMDQEVVTDSATRRQLCVRICGHTRDNAGCSDAAPDEGSAAAETAGVAPNGAPQDTVAACRGDPDEPYRGVLERIAGLPVHAPPGVEVVTDMWAFKRRHGLLASPK